MRPSPDTDIRRDARVAYTSTALAEAVTIPAMRSSVSSGVTNGGAREHVAADAAEQPAHDGLGVDAGADLLFRREGRLRATERGERISMRYIVGPAGYGRLCNGRVPINDKPNGLPPRHALLEGQRNPAHRRDRPNRFRERLHSLDDHTQRFELRDEPIEHTRPTVRW